MSGGGQSGSAGCPECMPPPGTLIEGSRPPMTVRTTSTTVLIRRQQRVVKISAAIHTRVTARVPNAIAAGVDAPVGRYSGRYFDNYSRASPCRCHPSVPPRRTATSRKPAASSSVAARADRLSVLQTTTTGCRRAASSPARPDRSASGTLTAPGRWPGGAVNSSG